MTLFGIIGCMVLLVGGLGMKDTMDAFMQSFYDDAIGYETRINLDSESMTNEEAGKLAEEYKGDWSAMRACSWGTSHFGWRSITSPRTWSASRMRICTMCRSRMTALYLHPHRGGLGFEAGGCSISFSPYGSDATYTLEVAGSSAP